MTYGGGTLNALFGVVAHFGFSCDCGRVLVTHGALGTILVYLGGGYRVGLSYLEFQLFYLVLASYTRV